MASSSGRGGMAAEVHLKLYVAGSTPNSERAKANLQAAVEASPSQPAFRLEIIDVLTDGRRAVIDSVIVTPTLIAPGSKGRSTMIGDLSDTAKLMGFIESAAGPG